MREPAFYIESTLLLEGGEKDVVPGLGFRKRTDVTHLRATLLTDHLR